MPRSTPAAETELSNVALTLRDVTWPARGPTQLELAAGLPGGGLLSAAGTAELDQQRAQTRITLKNVDLSRLQPYLPFRGRLTGRADGDLEVRGDLEPFGLGVRGTLVVNEAAIEDLDRPLLAVERLELAGLDYRWPRSVTVEQLAVRRPWARVDRDERGDLRLREAFVARRRGGAERPADAGPTVAAPEIVLKRVLIEEGATSIVDDSVEPAARFEVRGTRLEARNVTYPVRGPADVALTTPMPGGGRLEARGTFELEPGRMDVRTTVSGLALAPAQPYLPVAARLSGTMDGIARIRARSSPSENGLAT